MSDHTIVVIQVIKTFLYSFSVYSCHLFLISPVSVRHLLLLSFTVPIFASNIPLLPLIFLKRSLVFPILFSLFHCIVYLRRLVYLSLLFSAFSCVYLSLPWPFTSFLFLAICKASSDNHFAFLHFLFLGMVLVSISCTRLWTSIHNSSSTLSTRSNPLNLFVTYISIRGLI